MRPRLMRGVTREVILTKNYAFKFPSFRSWKLFLHGLLANMMEREWSGFKICLCPVLYSLWGGFLVVMPRIETFPDALDDVTYKNHFGEKEDYTLEFIENKPNHFGYYKGHLVAVDYGNC